MGAFERPRQRFAGLPKDTATTISAGFPPPFTAITGRQTALTTLSQKVRFWHGGAFDENGRA